MTNVPDFIPDGILSSESHLEVETQLWAERLLREADLLERLASYRRRVAQHITDNPDDLEAGEIPGMLREFAAQMASLASP